MPSQISLKVWSQRKNFQADVASTLIWVSVLISVELLWNRLTCISRFTTDLWHKLQKGLFFRCNAFLCRSMFLFLGKTLWQISQGNWPRLPSWISDMCTRRFFWLPKYLLHTPHMYCLPPAASGRTKMVISCSRIQSVIHFWKLLLAHKILWELNFSMMYGFWLFNPSFLVIFKLLA